MSPCVDHFVWFPYVLWWLCYPRSRFCFVSSASVKPDLTDVPRTIPRLCRFVTLNFILLFFLRRPFSVGGTTNLSTCWTLCKCGAALVGDDPHLSALRFHWKLPLQTVKITPFYTPGKNVNFGKFSTSRKFLWKISGSKQQHPKRTHTNTHSRTKTRISACPLVGNDPSEFVRRIWLIPAGPTASCGGFAA